MILVTGANGTTGTEVVRELVKTKRPVRALVRNRAKAAKFDKSVEVVVGDLTKPEALAAAFAGIEAAYVVAPNDGTDIAALEANAFQAAKKAGVKKIVKLSAFGVDTPLFEGAPLAELHVHSEKRLRELGIPWTVLRPGPFMSSIIVQWRILETGKLALPTGNAGEPLISPTDIGAAAAATLAPGHHDGRVIDMTGPELISYADAVKKIGRALGRELQFVDMPHNAWREAMLGAGVPEGLVTATGRWYEAVRNGRVKVASGAADVLGRKGQTLDQWLADGGATRVVS